MNEIRRPAAASVCSGLAFRAGSGSTIEEVAMAQMTDAGYALLRLHEGCIFQAYDDANDQPVQPSDPIHGTLTIGYGHTGGDVVPGLVWTQDQADEALQHDVAAVVTEVSPLITAQLTDNQFSAFVCLAYNIGLSAFAGSSALHLANTGDLADVPAHIALWNKTTIDGQLVTSAGLTARRAAEIALWNS
jgi:lysozyme